MEAKQKNGLTRKKTIGGGNIDLVEMGHSKYLFSSRLSRSAWLPLLVATCCMFCVSMNQKLLLHFMSDAW